MKLELNSFKLDIFVDVGPINNKKEEVLDRTLTDSYPEKKNLQDMLAYISREKTGVLVCENFISYQIESSLKLLNLETTISDIALINNSLIENLLLDGHTDKLELTVFGSVPALVAEKDAALNQSIRKFTSTSEEELRNGFQHIKAVGLRFMCENEENLYDIRLEPLMSDTRKYFLAVNVKPCEQFQLINLESFLRQQINYFSNDIFYFTKKYFMV